MNEFVTALGLVLVIEGLPLCLRSGHLKHMMAMMQHLSDEAFADWRGCGDSGWASASCGSRGASSAAHEDELTRVKTRSGAGS